ncbi:hypothetical protein HDE68_000573 [Pedobacter cryoconitis]|uniref:Lipoprotein n=1 Tax=Pedobacter cryoconitis TaxID=188932 RepID=A0A7W9DXB2_9SPHI|nr:hypothetical protein [Pedobacter cryoconitis]MBB5634688.1 hypothetical protein [Pedobacter cryoconitis]
MKRLPYILQQSALCAGLLFVFACNRNQPVKISPPEDTTAVVKKTAGAFPFHKDIVIKPGLHFEILSWGKGVDSLGGYLILMSDSTKNNYKSFSVERSGVITDAWNMDMDNDGNPELYIELQSKKNVKDLNVYEYNGSFNKISFPPLSAKMKKIYDGNDQFIQKNGELFRTFPIVNSSDSTQKNGALKTLHYSLRGNSFSVDEVKEQK